MEETTTTGKESRAYLVKSILSTLKSLIVSLLWINSNIFFKNWCFSSIGADNGYGGQIFILRCGQLQKIRSCFR
jgi:hypothetical protein